LVRGTNQEKEKTMNENWIDCPNHEGAYDCTPFCRICEGNQGYDPDGEGL